ncbi:hypothetical protein GCM10027562_28620 [Arthrobacter pigmenti]
MHGCEREVVGFARPDNLTGFLIWVYTLLAAVVIAAPRANTSLIALGCLASVSQRSSSHQPTTWEHFSR